MSRMIDWNLRSRKRRNVANTREIGRNKRKSMWKTGEIEARGRKMEINVSKMGEMGAKKNFFPKK